MYEICYLILLLIFDVCSLTSINEGDGELGLGLGQLPFCQSQQDDPQHLKRLVFVSTLDGKLSALNMEDGGMEKWNVPTGPGPMLSSSIHRLELSNNGQWIRMIPSLNGGLYKFNGEHIEAVPITADHLLKSSFRYSDELIISGGKESRTYGVDINSGQVLYECSMNSCENVTEPGQVSRGGDIVLVQRQTQTVRAVEPRSGIERWNFSVGQHDVKIARDPTSAACHSSSTDGHAQSDLLLKVIVPDGLVCALSKSQPGRVLWKHKFDHPVVSAWHMVKGELKWVDLFGGDRPPQLTDPHQLPESPILYIGMHNKQLYIQESVRLQHKIIENSNLRLQHHLLTDESNLPRIPWRPVPAGGLLGISGSKEPVLQLTDETSQMSTTALSVLYASEYVNGDGFYLYDVLENHQKNGATKTAVVCAAKEKINITINKVEQDVGADLVAQISFIDDDELFVNEDEDEKQTGETTATPVQVIFVSVWSWWIEVLVTSITLAIFVNLIIQRRFIRLLYSGHVLNEERTEEFWGDMGGGNGQQLTGGGNNGMANFLTSSNSTLVNSQEYISRYLTDFEPINCLGKGGFGVVFQAKNKIDDCHYAIKRIPLPHKEELHDRMMREVKALAKLDHQNIVRYFNSWVEDPPPNWQQSQDEQWAKEHDGEGCSSEAITSPTAATPSSRRNIIKSLWDKASSFYASNISLERSIARAPILSNRISDRDDDTSDASYIVFERSKKESSSVVSGGEWNSTESPQLAQSRRRGDEKDEAEVEGTPVAATNNTSSPSQSGLNRKYLYIQMQLCKRDTLKDWLRANPVRDKDQVLDIFNQIVRAVEYVHLKGLIHRDLKPSNIFFSVDGQIKVGDFGLVTAMIEGDADEYASPVLGTFSRFVDERHTARVGTQLYMSPEQVIGKQYDYKVDIYSLGVILFELLINFTTEMERYKTLNIVRKNQFPSDFNENYPHEFKLLQMMLSKNPKLRPTTIGVRSREPLRRFQSETGDNLLTSSEQWHFQLPHRYRDSSFSKSSSSQESSSTSC